MTTASPSRPIGHLSPPPRALPISLRCRMLGNLAVIVGAVLLAIGLIVGVFMSPLRLTLRQMALARGSAEAVGVVTAVEQTRVTVNEQQIYRLHFRFNALDGHTFTGTSYARG